LDIFSNFNLNLIVYMPTSPLILFVLAIGILLFGIIRLKINPFLVLLSVGIFTGLAAGLPITKVTKLLSDGFGSTMGSIGIMVALGILLGKVLADAGATEQIARLFLNSIGARFSILAICITGYIVCIPVFLTAAFIVFMPLLRDLSKKGNIPLIGLVTSLTIAGLATHCIVIPTPGPLAVMGNLNLPVGSFLFWALIVAIPPALAGLISAKIFSRQAFMQINTVGLDDGEYDANRSKPSGSLSLFVLLLPILLILIGGLMAEFLPKDNSFTSLFSFIGDKNIAMLIGVAIAGLLLKKYFSKSFETLVASGGADAGLLILIVGAGGAFGSVINGSGISDHIVKLLSSWNMPLLVTAFLLTAILRAAQGSATVAAVTVSSIMAPMLASSSENPVMIGLAICCGSICMSFPNDSGFWVISRYSGLTVPQNLRMLTLMSTITGIVGFLTVLLINSLI
jgi:GntP family gluconate:H+ symporter